MNVPARLAAFGVALALAGLIGAGLGAAVGPVEVGGGGPEAPSTTTAPDGDPPAHEVHGGG